MVLKLRVLSWSLIFTIWFFHPILWAAELKVPLPKDALMVAENPANFGPLKSVTRTYQSSFTQAKLDSFYKKEMLRAGWALGREGVFIKDNYMVVLVVSSLKDEAGKTNFSYTISNIPAKEEFLTQRRAKPEKLDFMPVYPGSVELFLWHSPVGVTGSYETENSIKEVVFFYKSGMLNYGWSLDSETPAGTENTDSKISLEFHRQDGAICKIIIAHLSADPESLPEGLRADKGTGLNLAGRTTILVTYDENKKIKS